MTQDEARQTIHRAWQLRLSGAQFISALGPGKVAAACNGIGPEWLPEKYRAKLDKGFAKFRIAADVHDCRFAFDNDGSDAKFRAANDELERNCLIVADATYAWYNPVRYWARIKGRAIAQACRMFGWTAWREAFAAIQSVSCANPFPAGAGNAGGTLKGHFRLDAPSA